MLIGPSRLTQVEIYQMSLCPHPSKKLEKAASTVMQMLHLISHTHHRKSGSHISIKGDGISLSLTGINNL